MTATAAAPSQPVRSPLLNLLLAGVCGWGAFALWPLGQAGQNWAILGSVIAAALTLRFAFRGLDAGAARKRLKHAERAARTVRKTHGRARWATRKDARRAGMHRPGGFFLGSHAGRDLYHNGPGSAFVFAPPGSGKGVASVIPNLLMPHRDDQGRPVSMLVLDLKAELWCTTSRRMRRLGYHTVAVAPWAVSMSRQLGVPIEDVGYNPVLHLLDAGDETKDRAEQLAELLLPGTGRDVGASEYFLDFGRNILAWGLLVLAAKAEPDKMNLVELRRLFLAPVDEFEALLAASSECDDFAGALREYAHKLISTKLNAPEEWSGAINTATKALRVYDGFGPLGAHASTTGGFDFARIKERPTVVYIILPAERVGTHGPWLNLVLSTAIERMGSDRTTKRVLCLLDEFANAGYLPNVLKAMGLYRGQGLQFALYAQTASQIRRLYGEDGLRDMLGMSESVQAFGVRDPETLKMLSELAGQDTVKIFGQSLSPDVASRHDPQFSTTAGEQGKSLIRPEDIRTLPTGQQLIFYRNLPPILAQTVSYLDRRRWRNQASPNPYYRS